MVSLAFEKVWLCDDSKERLGWTLATAAGFFRLHQAYKDQRQYPDL